MDFVGNLLLFSALKNFENPLRIDKVREFAVLLFGDTVYKACRCRYVRDGRKW